MKNKKVIEIIKKIENKGGNASMIMLGNAVFSDSYFKGSKILIIKDKGACLYSKKIKQLKYSINK